MTRSTSMRHCGIALVLMLLASPAAGQSPPAGSAPTKEALDEAATRFDRGTQLYKDGDYKLALIEFQRAYDLAHNYRVLYNIAQVNFQLNNYARALETFERYLVEGGSDISAQRREDVQKEIDALRVRTAHITISCNVEGAEITVDGAPAGVTPLAGKLLLDAGSHKIVASKSGRGPATRDVSLAGADDVRIDLVLAELGTAPLVAPPPGTQRPSVPPAPAPNRSFTWIGWVGTGVFAAGGAAFGIGALASSKSLEEKRDDKSSPAASGDLESAATRTRALAITADVLFGAAVITGGITIFLSLRGSSKPTTTGARQIGVGLASNGVSAVGTF